jgi:hypothetical protein
MIPSPHRASHPPRDHPVAEVVSRQLESNFHGARS